MPPTASAPEVLNFLLSDSRDRSIIDSEPILLKENDIKAVLSSVTGVHLTKMIITKTTEGDLNKVAQILDVALSLALFDESSGFLDNYFDSVEEVVTMLEKTQLGEFWPYFEKRIEQIGGLAQGRHSISLLRICRSIIIRLDRELDSELIGHVIQFLAISKGLIHPSRLNKRGKKQLELFDVGTESETSLTPNKASETLTDLSRLGDDQQIIQFGQDLLHKLRAKRTIPDSSVDLTFPRPGLQWTELTPSMFSVLLLQALFAFSSYSADTPSSIGQIFEDLKSLVGKLDLTILNDRVFPSEDLWIQWKDKQYPSLDTTPISPLCNDSHDVNSKYAPPPKLSGIIGNDSLTHLLGVTFSLEAFYVENNDSSKVSDVQTSLHRAASKDEKDTLSFKAVRLQKWGDSATGFANIPVAEHPDVDAEEEKLHQKQRESEETASTLKRPQAPIENPSKRARLSYDDDSSGYVSRSSEATSRPHAAEKTARPLPY